MKTFLWAKLWKLPLCFLNDCYRFRSFKSLVYFELHFGVWFKMWEQIHSFSHSYPAFPKSFTLKNIFSQWCVFDTFKQWIKYPLTVSACIYLWTFDSIPMVYMSVFMLVVYWKRSVLIAIPKEDRAQKCTDYHSIVLIYFCCCCCFLIVLISHASKAMLKIPQARLQQYMYQEFLDVQAAF